MASPTTLRPWRTSSAATVELSTPPLMATAMGVSSMHGDSSQVRHRGFQGFEERIHLFGRVGAAQGKSDTGARPLRRKPHGGENVGGRYGAARTGRARGDGEPAQIERDHQRLSVDAVEVNVGGIRSAV